MTKDVKLWEEKKAFTIAKWTAAVIITPFVLLCIYALFRGNPFYAGGVLGNGVGLSLGYGLMVGLLALGVIKFRNWRHLKA